MNRKDEIIEEVRRAREAYAAKFNYDLAAMYEDLKASAVSNHRRLAELRPLDPGRDQAAST